MAHSEWALCILQRSPLGVWSAESHFPTPCLLRETAAPRTVAAARRAFQEELAQAPSGILPALLPTLPETHPSRSLPVLLRPLRRPGAGTAQGRPSGPCGCHAGSRLTSLQLPPGGTLTSPASRLRGHTHQPPPSAASCWITGESQTKGPSALGSSGWRLRLDSTHS